MPGLARHWLVREVVPGTGSAKRLRCRLLHIEYRSAGDLSHFEYQGGKDKERCGYPRPGRERERERMLVHANPG